ncbi:tRNA (adenosine(37)-N6)-threonylcarbamoyltransferase complex transferase subunit TsaD, partial [Candidatus Gracilibacteria bacterium]|nr:tRNA (adenosine(37)-N6)-threonylcarbamoyltransferase complex transferase subunit TsaD [Candidatus Gracilibacteria bacterium]
MYILAFETSCDDTSIAIFKNAKLIAMDTKSQIKEHSKTGGVVPEVAARLHANNIFLVLKKVLKDSGIGLNKIDYIACTNEPGLLPSLLVGLTVAKTLSKILNIPLILINHIQAHIFANLLERKLNNLKFPSICLTVSGGHNEIYLWESLFKSKLIGETLDDSAGEAFDKVSKMMGLGFPGGPIISKLANEYKKPFIGIFPKVLLEKNSLNFSFSGLKSAVKREVDKKIENGKLKIENGSGKTGKKIKNNKKLNYKYLTYEDKTEIAFEFEETITEILTTKLFLAAKKYNIKNIVLAGGVSANQKLKEKIKSISKKDGYNFIFPIKNIYSQDNAA